MIKSIRHRALRNYWTRGQAKGLNAQGKRIFLGAQASSPPRRNPAGKMPALPGEVSAGIEGVPALVPPDNSQMRLPWLNAGWIRRLRRILAALDAAERPEQMSYPGSYFHPLKGDRSGRYAVRLTVNVRVTFGWDRDGAVDVDIEDYH